MQPKKLLKKIKRKLNYTLNQYETKRRHLKLYSLPLSIQINLYNECNYNCAICGDMSLKGIKGIHRVKNSMTLEELTKLSPAYKYSYGMSFGGGFGESLLNPEFEKISQYLKSSYLMSTMVSTNGIKLNDSMRRTFLDTGFDHVFISIHAGTSGTYKYLLGGNFDKILANVEMLQREKQDRGLKNPVVHISYAINRNNISEINTMLDIVKALHIDHLSIYPYRDYGFPEPTLSPDEYTWANSMIDESYDYANRIDILDVLPSSRPYFQAVGHNCPEKENGERKCFLPWSQFLIYSTASREKTYYVGCCNTYRMFLLNLQEHFDYYGNLQIKKIWNHPMFQYLRQTVNTTSTTKRNPLCAYCKSNKRNFLKNTDNKENFLAKIEAFRNFYKDYNAQCGKVSSVAGLKLLPTEDIEYRLMSGLDD